MGRTGRHAITDVVGSNLSISIPSEYRVQPPFLTTHWVIQEVPQRIGQEKESGWVHVGDDWQCAIYLVGYDTDSVVSEAEGLKKLTRGLKEHVGELRVGEEMRK